ncbi:hypothetical protein [uncultured Chryseobacterium sp.]|uniref:hypothetical protein n=1 Tax=uncultured Chryseobacterium sp. TaxID=259322 RepID=UPI0025F29AB0|nr:hypothetical protein [uncultured Chryseobacterium sp.]
MKTKTLLFLLVMLSFTVFAQNKANPDEASVQKSLTYFFNSLKAKNTNQAVSSIDPKFFTVIPKEQLAQILEMTYNNPFVKVDILGMQPGKITTPELINGAYYSVADYTLKLKCNTGSLNDEMKKNIAQMMFSKYGKNNVKYVQADGSYLINAPMKACAISKDKKSWKLVFVEKEYQSKLSKILPKKVLDKI